MKYFTILIVGLFFSISTKAQVENENYDLELATRLGADQYGLKKYVFVLLKTGSNLSADKELQTSSFAGHLDNINKLVRKKK